MVDPVECVTPPPLTYTDTELQVSAQYRPGHITQAPHVTRTGHRANIRWYFTDASCARILGGQGPGNTSLSSPWRCWERYGQQPLAGPELDTD